MPSPSAPISISIPTTLKPHLPLLPSVVHPSPSLHRSEAATTTSPLILSSSYTKMSHSKAFSRCIIFQPPTSSPPIHHCASLNTLHITYQVSAHIAQHPPPTRPPSPASAPPHQPSIIPAPMPGTRFCCSFTTSVQSSSRNIRRDRWR
ncbi:hypothetical protein K469DRAFT_184075 [Zopfia rhizophila CBS 207.26]|uniref:Uncharacterized protein n=1 Tax=Zopfia rhizophila CBS 207.26 TaxID=1314779 RepID=A0A6A6DXK6_9PEZI|nr:hypothetical protein K469DRAFT_184075 [Zopfia rhizophila CBS 207.26]